LKILRNALAGFSGSSDAALRARGLLSLSDLSNLREIAEECYELINQGLDMEGKLPASAPEPLCIRLTMDLDGLARNVRELGRLRELQNVQCLLQEALADLRIALYFNFRTASECARMKDPEWRAA
jgi:hypothetical protein